MGVFTSDTSILKGAGLVALVSCVGIGSVQCIQKWVAHWLYEDSCHGASQPPTRSCSCDGMVRAHADNSGEAVSDAWRAEVTLGEGHPAQIQRRANLAVDEWINDFYALGRPVIVTDATNGWKIFDTVSDAWILENFNVTRKDDTLLQRWWVDAAEGDVTSKEHFETLNDFYETARLKRRRTSAKSPESHKGSVWSDEFDFTGIYFQLESPQTLDKSLSNPFLGQFHLPYFFPDVPTSSTAYFGGRGGGLPPHQDAYSCYVGWQTQVGDAANHFAVHQTNFHGSTLA